MGPVPGGVRALPGDALPRKEGQGWTPDGLRVSFGGAKSVRVVGGECAPDFSVRMDPRCPAGLEATLVAIIAFC